MDRVCGSLYLCLGLGCDNYRKVQKTKLQKTNPNAKLNPNHNSKSNLKPLTLNHIKLYRLGFVFGLVFSSLVFSNYHNR